MPRLITKTVREQKAELKVILSFRKLIQRGFSRQDAGRQLNISPEKVIMMGNCRGIKVMRRPRVKCDLLRRLARLYYPWCSRVYLAEVLEVTDRYLLQLSIDEQWSKVSTYSTDRWLDPWMTPLPPMHIRDLNQVMHLVLKYEDYYEVSRRSGYSMTVVRDIFGRK